MSTPTAKTIEITVSPEGAVSIKTAGFTGSSCRDATRDIEGGVLGEVPAVVLCVVLQPSNGFRPAVRESLNKCSPQKIAR